MVKKICFHILIWTIIISISLVSVAAAYVSDQEKSENPKKAFLKIMKEHYRDCKTRDHPEDFLCLALQANLEFYDIKSVPHIDSIAILPPDESYTFKGGLVDGLSKNLGEKSSYRIVDSTKTLEILKDQNLLNDYNIFRAELYNFDSINKNLLDKFAKLFNTNYLLIPRVYEYSLVVTEANIVTTSRWALELNLISVNNSQIEWTLVNTLKSVDLQMRKGEQLGEYCKYAFLNFILGFSASSPLGASRSRLKERKERLNPDYKEFTVFLAEIISTLGKYDLGKKQGVPEKEDEYKCWLRTGEFPRLNKVIY